MADPFLAEIRIFPFNFAPRGWAFCDGQVMSISQNTALFSLLGTTYGGDGRSNFALPNLQGDAPIHPGQGPGLSQYDLGQTGGSDTVTLVQSEMPIHGHSVNVDAVDPADNTVPDPTMLLASSTGGYAYRSTLGAQMVPMNAAGIAPAGADQPHNNLQPYLTLNFCIALQGVYPARN